jgi:hypothetical protein
VAGLWDAEVRAWSDYRAWGGRLVVFVGIEGTLEGRCTWPLDHGWEGAFDVLEDRLGVRSVKEAGETEVY